MKEDEVPQDEAFLEEGKVRDLCYVVDDKGNYKKALSKGWYPKNEAVKLAWNAIYERAEEKRRLILAGKLSPIAYYMELNIMDTGMLADYMGFNKRQVKRHLKMRNFNKLNPETLKQYAEAFEIEVQELTTIEKFREIKPFDED